MSTFNWKSWRVGLLLVALTSLFTAGAGLVDPHMTWRGFVAVFCSSMLTSLPLFLYRHPIPGLDAISPTNPPQQGQTKDSMKQIVSIIAIVSLAALAVTGCATQAKKTVQREPYRAAVVQTDNGTVLYPDHYQAFTNAGGNVQVFPCYNAIVNTNAIQFSVKRFLWGGDHTLTAFADAPYELHSGAGRSVLVDSKYNQLDSQFNSGTRFSGNSHLSVGDMELNVSTNGINAVGNAGSQLMQGAGALAGQLINKAATGK